MAGPASDYHRGDMDIQEQAATFDLFMGLTKWGSLALVAALALFVIWFCTAGGFMGGLATAVVISVLGVVALRAKPDAAH